MRRTVRRCAAPRFDTARARSNSLTKFDTARFNSVPPRNLEVSRSLSLVSFQPTGPNFISNLSSLSNPQPCETQPKPAPNTGTCNGMRVMRGMCKKSYGLAWQFCRAICRNLQEIFIVPSHGSLSSITYLKKFLERCKLCDIDATPFEKNHLT